MQRNKNKLNNHLWLARQRRGLRQKHVAYLLGHKTPDQVSRYEQGLRFPGLRMFLQFEIIYGMPARFLYSDLYEKLRAEIEARAQSVKVLSKAHGASTIGPDLFSEFCVYEELLRNLDLTQVERDQIRKHVVTLMRRMNDL